MTRAMDFRRESIPATISRTIKEKRTVEVSADSAELAKREGKNIAARNQRSGRGWTSLAFDSNVQILDEARGRYTLLISRTFTEAMSTQEYFDGDIVQCRKRATETGNYYHHATSWSGRVIATEVTFDPAFQTSESLEAFWASPQFDEVVKTYCTGEDPFSIVRTGDGRVVVSNADRSDFYAISTIAGQARAGFTSDPMELINADAMLVDLGYFSTVEDAFSAVVQRLLLSPSEPVLTP